MRRYCKKCGGLIACSKPEETACGELQVATLKSNDYCKKCFGKIENTIDSEVHLLSAMDGFFGSRRICKFCKTPTEFDMKTGERYCPKGCFRGEKILLKDISKHNVQKGEK